MNQNIKMFSSSILILFVLFLSSSCEKDDPVIPNQEEVITTMQLILTPSGGGPDVVFLFRDLDGDGGDAPLITEGTLAANAEYFGTVELLNEQLTPSENISDEVFEESDKHQFFYERSSGLNLTAAYEDADQNNKPIGLSTRLTTGASSEGTLKVTLRHEPDKSADGVANGNITNAGGETDIEVTFIVKIQ